MPYADVTKRRTYHTGYMQQWRARQARQTPPTLPGATQPETSRWAREAQRLQVAAAQLHAQAHDATPPLAVLLTLRSLTALVVEITGVLVTLPTLSPHMADLPRPVAQTHTLAVKPLQPAARALAAQVDKAFASWTVPPAAQRVLRQMAALLVQMTSKASGEGESR